MTSATTGASGGYWMGGYAAAGAIGKVFTLSDSRNAERPALPTKAPPKPSDGGYALQLDLNAHLGYAPDQASGFTDSTGFIWGAERLRFWDIGGEARLFETIPCNGLIWTPYVSATLDQQFGYSDALAIPAQPGQIADTIYYGTAQTAWGTQIGVSVQNAKGFVLGVAGIYARSSEYQVLGGRAYVRYVFPE
jgi:hypothetical protein